MQPNANEIIALPSTPRPAPAASPAGHPVEREAKFSVDITFELPGLGDVSEAVDALPELLLQAAYFDTPDLGLWRQGITVRHRTGEGPDSGLWTAKLPIPGDGPTLDRTELSWPGSRDQPPEALKAALLGVVRHSAFEVMAELTTRRRRLALRDGTGTSLAEIDDDHVTVVVDGQERGTFRQIEVELGPDGDPLLGPVTDRLARAGARPSNEPKLARALAVIVVLESKHDTDLDDRARMGDVVRARIADGLHRMLDHDVRLRLDPDDPPVHSIHQARVATRRLRSDLLLLGAVVDPAWVTEVRGDLKWMGQVLGAVRDADVLGLELEAAGGRPASEVPLDRDGLDELRARLLAQRRARADVLRQALASDRYLGVLDRLEAAVRHLPAIGSGSKVIGHRSPADRRARKVLPRLVAKRWRALDRAVGTGGRHPTDPQLHRMRIRSKQLRYAAETAEPVIGGRARRLALAAEDAQGILGDLHDTVAAQEWLATNARTASGPAAFTAGVLAADQVRRREELRHQWQSCWRRLDRKKVRGWLDRD